MSRSRIAFFLISAVLVLPMLMGTLLLASTRSDSKDRKDDDSFYKYLGVFSEVLGLIRQTYVDPPNMDALMAGALSGTTDALDPFSLYVPASAVEGYERAHAIGRRNSGMALLEERGIAYVVAVEKGSSAGLAGVKAGDIVAKLNDRTTRTMPLWEVEEILAGKPGTKVTAEVIRLGSPVTLSFELKPFDPPPVSLDEVQGVAVLRIPTFDGDTAGQVRQARAGGKAHGRLLVDLRGVASGDPEAAYATAQLFASGDLGVLKSRQVDVKSYGGNAAPLFTGKLAVLIDRGTLGAAELFATTLRQKLKVQLVGERTFGYAGRQASAELSSGGRLFFTDAFYTGPDKKPLKEGLKPDVQVERTRTYLEKDVPIDELILRRGVRQLLGEQEVAKKAA
ncbi:MAG TPA: S41 family peptidase [Thermoanaerobaculia bacterium]